MIPRFLLFLLGIAIMMPESKGANSVTNTNTSGGWRTNSGTTNWNASGVAFNSTNWGASATGSTNGAVFTNTTGNIGVSNTIYFNSLSYSNSGGSFTIGTSAGQGTMSLVGSNSFITITNALQNLTIGSFVNVSTNLAITNNGILVFSNNMSVSGANTATLIGSGTTTILGNLQLNANNASFQMSNSILDMNGSFLTFNTFSNESIVARTGSLIRNASFLILGTNNSLVITNGSSFFESNNSFLGVTKGLSNSLLITSTNTSNSIYNGMGYDVVIGATNSSNNKINVGIGGILTNVNNLYVGGSSNSGDTGDSYNTLQVTNGGMSWTTNLFIGYGNGNNSNSVFVWGTNSILVTAANINIGFTNGVNYSNSLIISNAGIVSNTGLINVQNSNSSVSIIGAKAYVNSLILSNVTTSLQLSNIGTSKATLVALSSGSWISGSGTLLLNGGGELDANGFIVTNTVPMIGTGSLTINSSSNSTGTGTLALSATNSYSGGTAVLGGTLQLLNDGALSGSRTITLSGGALNLGGITLSKALIFGAGTSTVSNGTLQITNSVTTTANITIVNNGLISFATNLTISANTTTTLAGNGTTTVPNKTLAFGNNTSFQVSNNTLNLNTNILNFSGSGQTVVVSNGGIITNSYIAIPGTNNQLILTNGGSFFQYTNSYVGVTGSRADSLLIGSTNAVISLYNGGLVALGIGASGSNASYNQIVVGSGGVVTNVRNIYIGGSGSGNINDSYNQLIVTNGGWASNGSLTYIGYSTNDNSNSIVITGEKSYFFASGSIYVGYPSGINYGNSLSVLNGGNLSNVATTILANTNSYLNISAGNAYVSSILLSNTTTTLQMSNNGITNGAVIALSKGLLVTGSGKILLNGGGELDANGFIVTNTVSISGAGSLTVNGNNRSGTLVLASSNSYKGGTYLEQGILVLATNNSLGSGTLIVDGSNDGRNCILMSSSSTTNAGLISITNTDVLLTNGPSIVPGNGFGSGTLIIKSLSMDPYSSLNIYVGSNTVSQLSITGTVSYGGAYGATLNIITNNNSFLSNGTYTILKNTGASSGGFNSINCPNQPYYTVTTNAQSITLTVANLSPFTNGMIVEYNHNTGNTNYVTSPPSLSGFTDGFHTTLILAGGIVTGYDDGGLTYVPPPSNLTSVLDIAAGKNYRTGQEFFLALNSDRSVVEWGRGAPLSNETAVTNSSGQVYYTIPTLSNVSAIAGCGDFAFAVTSAGNIIAWGNSGASQVIPIPNVQVQIPAHLQGVQEIAGGEDFGMILTKAGNVLIWGAISTPPSVAYTTGIKQVSASFGQAATLTTGGRVYTWGYGTNVPAKAQANVVQVACGGDNNGVNSYVVALLQGGQQLIWNPVNGSIYSNQTIDNLNSSKLVQQIRALRDSAANNIDVMLATGNGSIGLGYMFGGGAGGGGGNAGWGKVSPWASDSSSWGSGSGGANNSWSGGSKGSGWGGGGSGWHK